MMTSNHTPESTALRPSAPVAKFIVTRGPNAGATFDLRDNTTIFCGSDIENDVILTTADNTDVWKIQLRQEAGEVNLTLLEGELSNGLNDVSLDQDRELAVARENEFLTNSLSFEIRYPAAAIGSQTGNQAAGSTSQSPARAGITTSDSTNSKTTARQRGTSHFTKNALYIFSVLCIALAILSGMYAVTGSVILANADTAPGQNRFMEKITSSKLAYLDVKQIGGDNRFEVKGSINSREEQALLKRIAKETGAEVTMQLQINNEVLESVEDIFRVNGIQAQAEVTETGGIGVYTQTADNAKLNNVRQVVTRDIPSIAALEIFNTPPVVVDLPKKRKFKPTPEKRITLISAGENAYIMTEDKEKTQCPTSTHHKLPPC